MEFVYQVKYGNEDVSKALEEMAQQHLPDVNGYHVEMVSGYIPYLSITFKLVEDKKDPIESKLES